MTTNLYDSPPDWELEGVTLRTVGKNAGGELLGATAYELAPGARWADLHYHHANEELLLVLDGRPTLHTLDGARGLERGDVVAFRRGRGGAHRLSNETGEPARVVLVSTTTMPDVVEYPESERVLVMSEPPWSEEPYDPGRGRVIRSFAKADGRPIPPDAEATT
jgi:uncharacterized cupin superfamily protein